MSKTHKKQHTIPRSYLYSWIEPVTPTGQTKAINLISKMERKSRRKSPEKCFTETDRYTIHLKNGDRDLTVEHCLGRIEDDFQHVLKAIRSQHPLTSLHKAKLCAFVAAMLARSKQQGDWIRQQQNNLLDMVLNMESSVDAEPITSKELQGSLEDHHGKLVAHLIPIIAPLLYQMTLTILTTNDTIGFITSDAPAIMYNPKSHIFPPMYRSPGLLQRDVEVTLPLSPKHLALFSYKPLHHLYLEIAETVVDEVNRTTYFHCEQEFISRTGHMKEFWFSERNEPPDAWKPMP